MPTPKPADVDAYLAARPPEVRAALVKVRAAMRRALPTPVEAIKYGMPAYLVDGRAVASFAGWKDHYALYIVSPALFEAITKDLEGREASKAIIRFNLDEPVPESVVVRLSEWNAGAGGSASAVPKKPTKQKAAASPAPKRNTRKRAPRPVLDVDTAHRDPRRRSSPRSAQHAGTWSNVPTPSPIVWEAAPDWQGPLGPPRPAPSLAGERRTAPEPLVRPGVTTPAPNVPVREHASRRDPRRGPGDRPGLDCPA